MMDETTANVFKKNLQSEVDHCIETHNPLKVRRRKGEGFVVIGEKDWIAIEETLYLNQIPGLPKSIMEAPQEPLE